MHPFPTICQTLIQRLACLPRLSIFLAFINLIRLFHRNILMNDGANGFDHAHRRIGLENISPHIDADGAVA